MGEGAIGVAGHRLRAGVLAMAAALAMGLLPAQAGTGVVIRSDNVEAEFGDTAGGLPASNGERLDHLYWIDSDGLRSADLAQVLAPAGGCSDAGGYPGQAYATPDGARPVVTAPGSLSSLSGVGTAASHQVSTAGLHCGGVADAIAETRYRVFPGDASRRNLLRILRSFQFGLGTPSFDGTALRAWTPRLALTPYRQILFPNAAGTTIQRIDAGSCTVDCPQSDWNGRWFASDDGAGRGIAVIRSPLSTAPARLVIRSAGGLSNLSAIALLQPAAGWRAAVSEIEYLCFYDARSWSGADQLAGRLPQGCAPETLAYDFGRVGGSTTFVSKTSKTLSLSGLVGLTPISVVNGRYRLNGGSEVAGPGMVNPGDSLSLVTTSAGTALSSTQAIAEIGGRLAIFETVTGSADTAPDAYGFGEVLDAPAGSVQTSATVTVRGLNTTAAVSVSGTGASYSLNGGAFTTAAGSVVNGSQLRMRMTASSTAGRRLTANLRIGSVFGRYDVVTAGGSTDTVPAAFAFPAVVAAEPGSVQISAPVTVSDINAAAPIAISAGAGSYSVNGGPFTTAAGTVVNGATVTMRLNAPTGLAASASTSLTIGGVGATFMVTTRAADTTPNAFAFAPVVEALPGSEQFSAPVVIGGIDSPAAVTVSGGDVSVDGGPYSASVAPVGNGAVLRLRVLAAPQFGGGSTALLSVGGVSATFTVTTVAADAVPDPFAFAPATGVAAGSVATSEAAIITGLNTASPIGIDGGVYSIDGAPFTATSGAIGNGSQVRVQLLASSLPSTTSEATLTIGGVAGRYTVTTAVAAPPVGGDTSPDPFPIPASVGQNPGILKASTTVFITGIDAPAPYTVSGGMASFNGGAYTSEPGTVANGTAVKLRLTTATSFETTTAVTLNVGGVIGRFEATTRAAHDGAEPFAPPAVTGAARDSDIASAPVAIRIERGQPLPIAIAGGQYSLDGGPFTGASGTVTDGMQLVVRLRSSSDFNVASTATVTIGERSEVFTVTTADRDTVPDFFLFRSVAGVPVGVAQVSNAVTITGINVATPISVSRGRYSLDGRPFTSVAGVIEPGASVRVEATIPSGSGSSFATLTVGASTANFAVNAATADTTPDAFAFASQTLVGPNRAISATGFKIAGINAAAAVSIVGGSYKVGSSPLGTAPGWINPGQSVNVAVQSSPNLGETREAVLTIGGVSARFNVTTASHPTPGISPDSGAYAGAQTVIISAASGSPAEGRLYYTLDGSVPTTASMRYSGPFTVSRNVDIRAAFLTDDGRTSASVLRNLVIYERGVAGPEALLPITGIELRKWRLDLPTGAQNNPDSVLPATLSAGYQNPPYFTANGDQSLSMFCPVTGVHSSGSAYARTELREMNLDGTLARWRVGERAQGLHASFTISQVPSLQKIVVGQIHADTSGIAEAEPLAKLVFQSLQGELGTLRLLLRIKPTDSVSYSVPIASAIAWGETVTYHLQVSLDGMLTVIANGDQVRLPIDASWRSQGLYFKAGVYVQDNAGLDSEGGAARFAGVRVDP
jgi:hypothetical protein